MALVETQLEGGVLTVTLADEENRNALSSALVGELITALDAADADPAVSGAGGGDLGVAFSADPEALAAFKEAAGEKYGVVELRVDTTGLSLEEQQD